MRFRLSIPGRDDIATATAANPANPLIPALPISRLAELAANEVSILPTEAGAATGFVAPSEASARATTGQLIRAAMKVCIRHGDNDAARQEMREQCLALPPHLQADLLEHFNGTKK